MINFSETTQAFYADDLNYPELPNDLIEVTPEQHTDLLSVLNTGCHVFSDLTYSAPRPTSQHTWVNGGWSDVRTDEEKQATYLRTLRPLDRRQFKLMLLENDLLSRVDIAIAGIGDTKQRQYARIEYDESTRFARDSSTLTALFESLGVTSDQLNEMWEWAMNL